MRRIPLLLSVLVPFGVLALDFTDSTARYKDTVSFTVAERAGIAVLTNIGAVQGNPDGTFAADRTLNRAEFTKIVLLSHPKIAPAASDAADCFGDVHASDWFSRYVCLAKKRGMVAGYPDGLFHPEREVNYAEALKILVLLYESNPTLECPAEGIGDEDCEEFTYPSTAPWYMPYADWAKRHGLLLPLSLEYDALLTRGQMARLAASFRAYSEGELENYRRMERKQVPLSSSSVSSRASSVSSASLTSSVSSTSLPSSSSVSSVASATGFPATSHFLLLGEWTPPLLDGTFRVDEEDATVGVVNLKLRREIRSLDRVFLIDTKGTEIAELRLETADNTDKLKWKGTASGSYRLTKGTDTVLGVKALLKGRNGGGASDELFEVESFSITVSGVATNTSPNLVPANQHYPFHQTAQAQLKSIRSTLPAADTLREGERRLLGAFLFSGSTIPGAQLNLSEVNFQVESAGVTLSRFRFGGAAEIEQGDCGVESGSPPVISCTLIPDAIRSLPSGSGKTLLLYGTVALSAGANPFLQLKLDDPGAIGRGGAVRWTDGTGRFNWMDASRPLATGTRWTVTK